MKKLRFTLPILIVLIAITTTSAQQLDGDWKGFIDIQGTKLTIITHFDSKEDSLRGTIDIPQQGGFDIPLQKISLLPSDSIHFEFMAGLGTAKFKGKFTSDTTINGTFHQSGQQFPFQLTKEQSGITKKKTSEEREASLPYTQEELVIRNDSVSIGGTLTQPKSQSAKQLVIIISGSGAQNRDGEIPITDFEPYAALAGLLSTNGISTFRYDDRGIGQSTGNFSQATLDILSSDVEAIINHFRQNPSHSFSNIILLGHSQGGMIAAHAAAKNNTVDKLILMASTGVPLSDILRFQVRQAFANASVDSSLVEDEIAAREQLMKAVVNNREVEEAQKRYRNEFNKVQISMGADSAQASSLAKKQADQLAQTFQSPQMKSLLFYDPSIDLQQLDIPVLVLFGGKDTQVTTKMNKSPIETALDSAGVSYQTKVFEQANHLFQKAETGSVQEYGTLGNQFVDGFIQKIADWIKNQQ